MVTIISDHSDCQTVKGARGYRGTKATTKKGYTCQRWDIQEPTSNAKSNDPNNFPDGTLGGAANYCRNPDGDSDLWCYVVDGGSDSWDYCELPVCGQY